MIIVGGTYSEICFEPIWENIFGSGLRAVNLVLEADNELKVHYHTFADQETKAHLDYYSRIYKNRLEASIHNVVESPQFYYEHPLKTPTIKPRPDLFKKEDHCIVVKGKDILAYGLLEGEFRIDAARVVYDPQSPANPIPFSATGSSANELITIINYSEAKKLTQKKDLSDIVDYFFDEESCYALLLKMGAQGALLYMSKSDMTRIPVYETSKIWPIGSGDVFSAYFAYCWFTGKSLVDCAQQASKTTALYCDSKNLSAFPNQENFPFKELIVECPPKGQVYLAGPFFTFAERWLINEAWITLLEFGLKVFSPFHDVGHGKAHDVVQQDLVGLDSSKVVLAIIDGLDPGTLFEVGYAIASSKKVIAFVQKEGEEALKMLEGSNCTIVRDFTTAVYKTFWALAEKE